ncbi:thiol-disulfide oxidoreductase DCC family protein [Tenacibaculum caenipelagi]|uniref:Putative DCC family thiol-disulfide oxidoreductase YuxK n=1 Tax=Tenacibaculum caenipelagi TaxID=1325435 RepID=A0A4R6TEF1_9FLAO|nr:DCC1-like thiol-disulfide oxidoreductase family protein [Tenacibaculum caenipelagi]TDQ25486.1 putative DCC family thiol-disulfide oxidoreductase YuxK [Tenacibaculum caenipelagi]
MNKLPRDKKIILFDGICNFCNDSVLKIIRYDTKNQFVFTSLQSDIGKEITQYLGIDTSKVDSIILYEPNVSYDIKSSAALKIMNALGGVWKLTQFFWLFPEGLRNIMYDFIAKNRYKWFGKKEECMIPSKDIRDKFI